MILAGALEKFKALELKMSEVYLWCSISFEDLELRQFFADMSDEELSHARALENIGKIAAVKDANYEIPDYLPERIGQKIFEVFARLKQEKELDKIFLLLAEMESSEINQAFDSIVKGVKDAGIQQMDHLNANTRRHILMLARQAEKLGLAEEVRNKIGQISVTDRDYFKLFIP
jgi:rubrerythrin